MDYRKIAFRIIIGTGFGAFIILFLFLFKTTELNTELPIDTNIFANYGVVVGSISAALLSLASVLLIIQNLNSQNSNFERQQLESRFFELIKIQRDNSNAISLKDKYGKKVFIPLLREFRQAYKLVEKANETSQEKLTDENKINVSYLCFFFGAVGDNSKNLLLKNLNSFSEEFQKELTKIFEQKQEEIRLCEKFNYKPFEGHQYRLGHYFRHLYQTVRYMNEQPANLVDFELKYKYIKTLRAQLSNQEQLLLFLNSLSILGMPWEKGKGICINNRLITKYNLIKNIPGDFTNTINVNEYYPDIDYEGQLIKTKNRLELEKNYRQQ